MHYEEVWYRTVKVKKLEQAGFKKEGCIVQTHYSDLFSIYSTDY